MFFSRQHLHFAGIGGIGMSGIAEVLLNLGYTISGSDLKLSPTTDRLAKLGATIYEGHNAENVAGAKALVVSSAVEESNPEVQEARRLQIPVIPRGELLAELMRLKYGIAVAGSHGKTTTTSMIATILSHAGMDPTVVVGGKVAAMGGSNARVGKSDFLVVEADESDGSFLKLSPIFAIVTNIDREHLDHYAGLEAIRAAFIEFVNKVPFYGAAILCLDDENVQSILPACKRRTITYGRNSQADYQPGIQECGDFHSCFTLRSRTADLGEFHLNIPGEHNVLNATAAIAVALELHVEPDVIREGLRQFTGVGRRFEVRGVERRRDRGRRLRPPSDRDPRHAGGGEILLPRKHARAVSAAPLYAHVPPDGRFRARLSSGRSRGGAGYLCRIGKADRGRHGGSAGGTHAAVRPSRRRIRGFERRPASKRSSQGVEPGDMILTLGAGSVSQLGEKILEKLNA